MNLCLLNLFRLILCPSREGEGESNLILLLQILLKIRQRGDHKDQLTSIEKEDDSCHLIIVNVSPIDYGHVLMVPAPDHCLPQVHV